MSLISRLLQTVQSWRRHRGGPRTNKRTAVTIEQLDHRQLLSVGFTGNVKTDFPASESPGVVVVPDNPSVIHPVIAPSLQSLVAVSGFDISGIRVTYTPADDTLSIGLDQPPAQTGSQYSVIAGDADDNGNDGTVNPAITAMPDFKGFQDNPDFGGTEQMGAFLDLKGSGYADVVAGYSATDPRSPKEYQVAQAVVNTSQPPSEGNLAFGTELAQYEGNVYKVNSPVHPNFEFSIAHFSQLYLAETGQTLTANSKISIGAFGGSANDVGISEAFFPEQSFTLSQATPPTHTCPPASPPVLINPHENRHINTAHPELVRVTILGSSGFNPTQIIPSTVTLGGAHPLFAFTRPELKTGILAETFVFDGDQINLPAGITQATVTGTLTDGTTFSTSERIFNKSYSSYSAGQQAAQQAKWAARGADIPNLPSLISKYERNASGNVIFTYTGGSVTPASGASAATATPAAATRTANSVRIPMKASASANGLTVDMGTATSTGAIPTSASSPTGNVVSIKKRQPASAGHSSTPKVSSQLQSSMNQYLQSSSAASATSAT
ncbi:MAG: hypothetical protein P4L84_37735 [Isosphaeraceae bacterium]|nr:hypothetical protein [Isosphaeraceae bacterium]